MKNSDNAGDLDKLKLLAELNRTEMRKAMWKAEELEAVLQTAQELKKRRKSKSKSNSKAGEEIETENGGSII